MASLAVCATKAEAENQFEELLQFVQEALQFLPCFRLLFLPSDIVLLIALGVLCSSFFLLCRLEEQGLARCSKSDLRRVRFISCAKRKARADLFTGECFGQWQGDGGGGECCTPG